MPAHIPYTSFSYC